MPGSVLRTRPRVDILVATLGPLDLLNKNSLEFVYFVFGFIYLF